MVQIGIDASRYRHPAPTGVEVYSDEIIDGLLALSKKRSRDSVVLYTSKLLEGIPTRNQYFIPPGRLWTQRKLTRVLRNHPPDVFFVPSHVLPRHHSRRSVITIHDVAFRKFPKVYSLFQYLYLEWSTRYAVKHAWKIIVPSKATSDDLMAEFKCSPEKIVVIPHGFHRTPIPLSPSKERSLLKQFHLGPSDPYVFFIGRLETKKNLLRLVRAFAEFRKDHPEWRLILGGGRGVGFKPMLRTMEKEQLLEHVLMPGYLTPEEKQVLFAHARSFAFPSLSEGFGFPILEAASYQLPILASNIPAHQEFKTLVDRFVDPQDEKSMAEGLRLLVDAPRRKKSITAYSWKRASQAVWNILTRAV